MSLLTHAHLQNESTHKRGLMLLTHRSNPHIEAVAQSFEASIPTRLISGLHNVQQADTAVSTLLTLGCHSIHLVRLTVFSPVFDPIHQQWLSDWRKQHHNAQFMGHLDGVSAASELDQILIDRYERVAGEPSREQLLLLAHGAADDGQDLTLKQRMCERSAALDGRLHPDRIYCETLREDWPEKRLRAISHIRALISDGKAAGLNTIVLPFRLSGFGPYAEVLDGLDYRHDALGMLPHPGVGEWIQRLLRG